MKSYGINKLGALGTSIAWAASITAMLFNYEFWGMVMPHIIIATVLTIVGTGLLCRFWCKNRSMRSIVSILAMPLTISVGLLAVLFALDGAHGKSGLPGLVLPPAVLLVMCLFASSTIVLFYQKSEEAPQTETSLD